MRVYILPKNEQLVFDKPSKIDWRDRRSIFGLPNSLKNYAKKLETPTSIVGFILQYGYFKISGKFFYIHTFYKEDIEVICKWNEIDINTLDWFNYHKVINHRQKKIILEHFGANSFGKKEKQLLLDEAIRLFKKQKRPDVVFWILTENLQDHRIEIPTYNALSTIITEARKSIDNEYLSIIHLYLTSEVQDLLDKLFIKEQESFSYNLTKLKRSNETLRLRDIRENIKDYQYFKYLYFQIKKTVDQLNLSHEMIEYYAQFVIRSQVFQVSRRDNRYLILICFIIYQYYFLGDLLLEVLLISSKEAEDSAKRLVKNIIYENQNSTEKDVNIVLSLSKKMAVQIKELIEARDNDTISERQRTEYYKHFAQKKFLNEYVIILDFIGKIQKKNIGRDSLYYQALEEQSRKLQNKTNDVLRIIDFETPNLLLQKAILEFKKKEGNISDTFENEFLSNEERKYIKKAKSLLSFYKILLTKHLAQGIKSGEVSLLHSFQNQPFENYLIHFKDWENKKKSILRNLNMTNKENWVIVEGKLKKSLQQAYNRTYEILNAPNNSHVEIRASKSKTPYFSTPIKQISPYSKEDLKSLFPLESTITILEILSRVNEKTHFTEVFTHWSNKSIPKRPSTMEFFAIIMAYGCNIGLHNIAKSTTNVSLSSLVNTSNWYFSSENIQKANDIIVKFTNQLKLVDVLQKEQKNVHTSSDGQKYYAHPNSIHSDYSRKYFGKDKGL